MKHHPDKGGDPEKFKEITRAYEAAVMSIYLPRVMGCTYVVEVYSVQASRHHHVFHVGCQLLRYRVLGFRTGYIAHSENVAGNGLPGANIRRC